MAAYTQGSGGWQQSPQQVRQGDGAIKKWEGLHLLCPPPPLPMTLSIGSSSESQYQITYRMIWNLGLKILFISKHQYKNAPQVHQLLFLMFPSDKRFYLGLWDFYLTGLLGPLINFKKELAQNPLQQMYKTTVLKKTQNIIYQKNPQFHGNTFAIVLKVLLDSPPHFFL